MIKLSIITVNLNNAEGLQKTLNSLANQSFIDYEHIIIDGGSTDGSLEIIKEYENKYNGIKEGLYWLSEPDKGIYHAMNKGILLSKGKWIFFLNSGDYLFSHDTIFKINKLIMRPVNVYIIYGNLAIKNLNNRDFIMNYNFVNKYYLFHNCIGQQAIIYKKEIFNKIRGFDQMYRIVGDYEFLLRAFYKWKIKKVYVNETFANYQWGGISNSPNYIDRHKHERDVVKKIYFSSFEMVLFNSNIYTYLNKTNIKFLNIFNKFINGK